MLENLFGIMIGFVLGFGREFIGGSEVRGGVLSIYIEEIITLVFLFF